MKYVLFTWMREMSNNVYESAEERSDRIYAEKVKKEAEQLMCLYGSNEEADKVLIIQEFSSQISGEKDSAKLFKIIEKYITNNFETEMKNMDQGLQEYAIIEEMLKFPKTKEDIIAAYVEMLIKKIIGELTPQQLDALCSLFMVLIQEIDPSRLLADEKKTYENELFQGALSKRHQEKQKEILEKNKKTIFYLFSQIQVSKTNIFIATYQKHLQEAMEYDSSLPELHDDTQIDTEYYEQKRQKEALHMALDNIFGVKQKERAYQEYKKLHEKYDPKSHDIINYPIQVIETIKKSHNIDVDTHDLLDIFLRREEKRKK